MATGATRGGGRRVLVAHASRHGSTTGIAQRIAERLRAAGHEAVAADVDDVASVDDYDAVVLGSAVYTLHWLRPATRFARRHEAELAARPLWLFSSGPLGHDRIDEDGDDVLELARPREFDELEASLQPRGTQVFFGAWDPEAPPKGIAERTMRMLPAGRAALQAGDFRDWDAIDGWADAIAADLSTRAERTP